MASKLNSTDYSISYQDDSKPTEFGKSLLDTHFDEGVFEFSQGGREYMIEIFADNGEYILSGSPLTEDGCGAYEEIIRVQGMVHMRRNHTLAITFAKGVLAGLEKAAATVAPKAQAEATCPLTYGWELKGSKWETDKDDHWCGDEGYISIEAAYAGVAAFLAKHPGDSESWIIITIEDEQGRTDMVEEKWNGEEAPGVAAARDLENDRRELANQAGMAFGCAGYNDAMGY